MKNFMKIAKLSAVFMLALSPSVASATQIIAHRGAFHDIDTNKTLAENSFYSVVRAHNMRLPGVELDLRLSSDQVPLVTHDIISNRSTNVDNYRGMMNSVDVMLGLQPRPAAVHISIHNTRFWHGAVLKPYGRGAHLIDGPFTAHIQSLDSMFSNLASAHNILHDKNFKIVLDIQNPLLLKLAAGVVKQYKATDNVYLKFFASKALYNNANYKYDGADTCYNYAKRNNMTGLNVIPQINDGELNITENDDAGINAFQTKLSIQAYLQCWADAQAQHPDAAKMPIVSASVPANNYKALKGATAALAWARSHGRKTMTIVPNPDAGRRINGKCTMFSFQSNNVAATRFNYNARTAKQNFANRMKPDYEIVDIMGNVAHGRYGIGLGDFTNNLCK